MFISLNISNNNKKNSFQISVGFEFNHIELDKSYKNKRSFLKRIK